MSALTFTGTSYEVLGYMVLPSHILKNIQILLILNYHLSEKL